MGVDNAGRDAAPLAALRISLGTMALIAAAAMPVVNLRANYAAADQSRKVEESRLYRALFEQLPHGAAVVSEDYSVDSALQYMMFTGAGDGKTSRASDLDRRQCATLDAPSGVSSRSRQPRPSSRLRACASSASLS